MFIEAELKICEMSSAFSRRDSLGVMTLFASLNDTLLAGCLTITEESESLDSASEGSDASDDSALASTCGSATGVDSTLASTRSLTASTLASAGGSMTSTLTSAEGSTTGVDSTLASAGGSMTSTLTSAEVRQQELAQLWPLPGVR